MLYIRYTYCIDLKIDNHNIGIFLYSAHRYINHKMYYI